MVLNRICKGAREINIAATLEHIRDQRPQMVKTKVRISREKEKKNILFELFHFRINLNLSSSRLLKKSRLS